MSIFTELTCPSIQLKINDETFILSPLGMKQWGEYCLWYQYRPYQQLKKIDAPDSSLTQCFEECRKKNYQLDSPEIRDSFKESESLAYLVFLAAKINNPKLDESKFSSYITHETYPKLLDILLPLFGLGSKELEKN